MTNYWVVDKKYPNKVYHRAVNREEAEKWKEHNVPQVKIIKR